MKKLLSFLIAFIYLLSSNACFAFSELLYIENYNNQTLKVIIENSIEKYDYSYTKNTHYVAKSNKDSEDYAVIILQPNGNDVYYYYESNGNKRINRKIKKSMKSAYINYRELEDSYKIETFSNIANDTLTNNNKNKYSFEETSLVYKKQEIEKKEDSQVLKGYVGQVSRGTTFGAYLQTSINTATAVEGEQVIAVLVNDWTHQGSTIASQGSTVYGIITKANSATYGSRNGKVNINFDRLVTTEGKVYNLKLEDVEFAVTNEGKVSSMMSKSAGLVAAGALLGLLMGLASSDRNAFASSAIGAGVGLAGGMIASGVEKGVDAEIPAFTEIELKLVEPLSIMLNY